MHDEEMLASELGRIEKEIRDLSHEFAGYAYQIKEELKRARRLSVYDQGEKSHVNPSTAPIGVPVSVLSHLSRDTIPYNDQQHGIIAQKPTPMSRPRPRQLPPTPVTMPRFKSNKQILPSSEPNMDQNKVANEPEATLVAANSFIQLEDPMEDDMVDTAQMGLGAIGPTLENVDSSSNGEISPLTLRHPERRNIAGPSHDTTWDNSLRGQSLVIESSLRSSTPDPVEHSKLTSRVDIWKVYPVSSYQLVREDATCRSLWTSWKYGGDFKPSIEWMLQNYPRTQWANSHGDKHWVYSRGIVVSEMERALASEDCVIEDMVMEAEKQLMAAGSMYHLFTLIQKNKKRDIATLFPHNIDFQNKQLATHTNGRAGGDTSLNLHHVEVENIETSGNTQHIRDWHSFDASTYRLSRGYSSCRDLWIDWKHGQDSKPSIEWMFQHHDKSKWAAMTGDSAWLSNRRHIIVEMERAFTSKQCTEDELIQEADMQLKAIGGSMYKLSDDIRQRAGRGIYTLFWG